MAGGGQLDLIQELNNNHFLDVVVADETGGDFFSLHLQLDSEANCDFDADCVCNIDDLNAMLSLGPIGSGVSVTQGVNNQFDLTGDGMIDLADQDAWLVEAAARNGLGSSYKLGDANLDGTVDGQDFVLWNDSKFAPSFNWNDGNFNGDATVDGADFIAWNANKFTSSDRILSVPEPSTAALMILAVYVSISCSSVRKNNEMHRSRICRAGSDFAG